MFNCYRHWAQLLLQHPGDLPVTILSQERVTQGFTLSMVLYRITLVPLAKELRTADPGLLYLSYADDAAFDSLAQQSAQLIKLLMERGSGWVIYLSRPSHSSSWTRQGRRRR